MNSGMTPRITVDSDLTAFREPLRLAPLICLDIMQYWRHRGEWIRVNRFRCLRDPDVIAREGGQ